MARYTQRGSLVLCPGHRAITWVFNTQLNTTSFFPFAGGYAVNPCSAMLAPQVRDMIFLPVGNHWLSLILKPNGHSGEIRNQMLHWPGGPVFDAQFGTKKETEDALETVQSPLIVTQNVCVCTEQKKCW